ncbi:alpha/beta hydrolase-fold protein [Caulobacter sp. BE254]|uniref:alpha/beta hydrolase n=1 Tax=Caulobacter sp. BE254 TaxID=2817720 RepID=UPI0028621601|nr:alpha/beta hydrolase-fold protein [Caulobacter sp. BE254]MDR7118994.1 hypothetical protein [Caulobacter sp. BE254]
MIDILAGSARLLLGAAIGLAFGTAHAEEGKAAGSAPRFRILPACTAAPVSEACQRSLTVTRAEAVVHSAPDQALNYELYGQTIDITFRASEAEPDFVFGDAPYLCCDLQTFLQPVAPNVWGISIEAPKLSAAILELTLGNLANSPAPKRAFQGPDATHVLVRYQDGGLVPQRRTINSHYLKESRDIYEYRGRLCEHSLVGCKVIYLADGAQFSIFLNNSPSPKDLKALDLMVIVGIANPSKDDQFGGKRTGELLADAGDNPDFDAFERFVTEEVIPFVESTPVPRTARSVGGWSNGGAWALSVALDRSDLFGSALAFSNGTWQPPSRAAPAKGLKVKFGGGTLERSPKIFEADARKVAATGASLDEHYVVGGHSISTWNALFWWAITP